MQEVAPSAVSTADASTQGVWQIDDEGYIVQADEPGVQIKSKKFSSVAELVGPNSQYRDAFDGGTLTHSFLNVYDYHRYHFPMSGKVMEVNLIEADYAVGGTIIWNKESEQYNCIVKPQDGNRLRHAVVSFLKRPNMGL